MGDAVLNKDNLATVAGFITVYNYSHGTREYLSKANEFIPVGVGLPANACTDEPPGLKKGFVICRSVDDDSWEYQPDHRGEIIWNTETSQPEEVMLPGEYPAGTTTLAPATPFDAWDGDKWVTDERAKKAAEVAAAEGEKNALILFAGSCISPLQDAVELDMATDEEKSRYISWRQYRVLLTRVDTSLAPDINWPEPPLN